jgi:hypothetical protein
MLTAAEGKELLFLVEEFRGLLPDRLHELATRVAHDMEIVEVSVELTEKCAELGKYTNKTAPAHLTARIRELAEHLARLDPEEPE